MVFLGLEFYLHSLERCNDQHEMSSVHEAGSLEWYLDAGDIPGTCYTLLKRLQCILNKNCACTSDFVALIFDQDR